ncbi:MAG: hypothetical protein ACREBC_30975, partial [Pyrinomonadaceae bacterium]
MPVTLTKPTSRADDTRALKRRLRRIAFTGNYTTGGETITAAQIGLLRIAAVNPLNPVVRALGGVAGTLPVFDVSADQKSVVIKQLEDAAGVAGTTIGQE